MFNNPLKCLCSCMLAWYSSAIISMVNPADLSRLQTLLPHQLTNMPSRLGLSPMAR